MIYGVEFICLIVYPKELSHHSTSPFHRITFHLKELSYDFKIVKKQKHFQSDDLLHPSDINFFDPNPHIFHTSGNRMRGDWHRTAYWYRPDKKGSAVGNVFSNYGSISCRLCNELARWLRISANKDRKASNGFPSASTVSHEPLVGQLDW